MTYAGMSVDEILKSLETGIRDFMQTERYKDYLRAVGRFHAYSTNNIALITMQRPDATLVAGYTTWKNAFKRSVKKGEKGIRIIAPYPVKIEKEKDVFDAYGNLRREKVTVTVPRFRCVSVFDVSQTEGERLPELEPAELNKEVDGYGTMIKALERTSRVPVSYRDIKDGARGFYDASGDRITVKSGMGQSQTVKTLIHEIAHSFLHGRVNGGALMPAGTKEVEAESVAYTVCSAFGIDTSEYTFPYVTAWAAKADDSVLRDSMDRIRETSSELIHSLSDNIREVRKEAVISDISKKTAEIIASSEMTLQSEDTLKIRVSELLDAGRTA
ncbi:MAG: DNA repair protein, partial [Oscillospiraceae bacterium]|nr:DNA repair protein [Oscillospiraceae bacterium]